MPIGQSPTETQSARTQPPSLTTSFGRAQASSLIATGVDYFGMVCLVEFAHVWYVAATAIGALGGAVSNFLLGRYWSFQATHGKTRQQALRYAVVSSGSLLLNSAGVYLITEFLSLPYPISRIITGLLVGVFFNFPLHRRFVFR